MSVFLPQLFAGLALTVTTFAAAQDSEDSTSLGAQVYAEHCASCHSASLRGSAHGAALIGKPFQDKWAEQPAGALLALSAGQMPPGQSATLSIAEHAAAVAYIIGRNRPDIMGSPLLASLDKLSTDVLSRPAPDSEAPPDATEFSGADAIMNLARNAGQFNNRTVDDFQAVSQQEINDGPASDWLAWRRKPDGHGHSPLKQIHRGNVHQLRLSWSMAMH